MAKKNLKYNSKIDQLRIEAGLTVYELAAVCGVTPQTAYNCIRDVAKKPLATLNKIAIGLQVEIKDLFEVVEAGSSNGANHG